MECNACRTWGCPPREECRPASFMPSWTSKRPGACECLGGGGGGVRTGPHTTPHYSFINNYSTMHHSPNKTTQTLHYSTFNRTTPTTITFSSPIILTQSS